MKTADVLQDLPPKYRRAERLGVLGCYKSNLDSLVLSCQHIRRLLATIVSVRRVGSMGDDYLVVTDTQTRRIH